MDIQGKILFKKSIYIHYGIKSKKKLVGRGGERARYGQATGLGRGTRQEAAQRTQLGHNEP